MKRTTLVLSVYLLLAGCIDAKATRKPKLVLNVDAINFCLKEAGETFVWNDLQLRNTGSGPVLVHGIEVRGDQGCAFQCVYESAPAGGEGSSKLMPCPAEGKAAGFQPIEIAPDTTLLLSVAYTPAMTGQTDNAALVVTSDAANIPPEEAELKKLVIPMCGTGIEPIGLSDGPDTERSSAFPPDAGRVSESDAGREASADAETDRPGASDAGETPCPACATPPEEGAPGCSQ
jgi:hypothetical protein